MPIIKQYTKLISIFEFVSTIISMIQFSFREQSVTRGQRAGKRKEKCANEFLGKQGMYVFEKQERRCYRRFQLIHQIAKNIFNQRVPAGERAEQKIPRSVRG